MNDAVYKFKRYEDASLSYTGIDCHEGEDCGGWDTVLSDANYNKMFTLQQASMEAPAPSPDDLPAKASGSKIHKPSNSYTPRPVGSSVGIGAAKPSFGLNS